MQDLNCELLVIGAGPGGYATAIRAGQLGLDTIIVESGATGGTCLNIGCIPSKALIHVANEFHQISAHSDISKNDDRTSSVGISVNGVNIDLAQTMSWKNGIVRKLSNGIGSLLQNAKVQLITGHARLRDGKSVVVTSTNEDDSPSFVIKAQNIVIATGSEAIKLDQIPFSANVISSTEALSLQEVPVSMAVIGGGYIGLEIGTAYAKLGCKVTVIENQSRLLPHYDEDLVQPLMQRLQQLGVTVHLSASITAFNEERQELTMVSQAGQSQTIATEKVLVCVGRKPRLTGFGLNELCLTVENGVIATDNHCQTSMRGVYAVGDITGEPMLAHRAIAQGELVARIVAGQSVQWDKLCIPAVCFTDPEIVTVGMSIQEAKESKIDFTEAQFPLYANGRALTLHRTDGFVRVIAQNSDGAVIGVQAVGSCVAELSAAFSLAIEMGATVEDVASTVHAHPTISESFQEACMRAMGHALHL